MYIKVTGELAPGWSVVVRWQDGDWSGDEFALEMIRQAIMLDCPDGMIGQSPTGPFWPVTSPEGASRLAVGPFSPDHPSPRAHTNLTRRRTYGSVVIGCPPHVSRSHGGGAACLSPALRRARVSGQ